MAEAKKTRDHRIIRTWAEERGGHPATVKGTPRQTETAGLLRIDFDEGEADEALERIDWKPFFKKFDSENLTFLYQEESADGDTSWFCKFVETEE
jgi:hypothetical protein